MFLLLSCFGWDTRGRGKQSALLIGRNQTFRVRYNRSSRRRGIRAPRLQLMRARVQAHSGDTFHQFLICELWPVTWQPIGLQHLWGVQPHYLGSSGVSG